MLSQSEKDEAFKRAKKRIKEENIPLNNDNYLRQLQYKSWTPMLQIEDLEGLTNEEIDRLVYEYKGNLRLFEQGTKEDGFDGKYKQEYSAKKQKTKKKV